MTKKLLFVTTILLVVAFVAFAADVTGKWTYEQPGRNGGAGRPTTITLKQDGTKLTGSVPAQMGGRRGGGDAEQPGQSPAVAAQSPHDRVAARGDSFLVFDPHLFRSLLHASLL